MQFIPGYSEAQCWLFAFEALNLPTYGMRDFLGKIFASSTSIRSAWFVGTPNVYLGSPENLEVLLKSVQHITKGREYFYLLPWLGEGLLTSTGAKWHANRKMLTPAFHFRILENCIPVMSHNAETLISILKENCKTEEVVNVEQFVALCSLDIISEAAMGVQLDAQIYKHSTLDYVKAVRRIGELVLNRSKSVHLEKDWIYYLTSEGREQKRVLHTLHSFTESVIKESKEKRQKAKIVGEKDQKPAAFVDFLLEMAENDPGVFSDLEIRQEVDTFMFEGHETTSSSIAWTLLLLGHDQDVQERVYNELSEIFDYSDRPISKKDLPRMAYLEAIIKESLRLYPPVSFMSRKLDCDLELEKYTVPAGVNILLMPYFLHRQSCLYPDPEKFDPNRFLDVDNPNRHPFMYIPFSGGPRNCIGQRFAMVEMKVVLSYIIRNFKIESVTKREGIKVLFAPILRPMHGTYVKLYPRC